jgi:beta-galactosidase
MGMLVHRPSRNGTISLPGIPEKLSLWGWPDELQSWSWSGFEGEPIQVRVFARGCEKVRLLLNGQHLSDAPVQSNLTAVFVVIYSPGTLTAVCVNGSAVVPNGPTAELKTASEPVAINLTVDRAVIKHDVRDLVYITAMLVDANGTMAIGALDTDVVFAVTNGPGKLVAVGSGDPQDISSLRGDTKRIFRGRAIAIVQPNGAGDPAGVITITATAKGLPVATVAVTTRKCTG